MITFADAAPAVHAVGLNVLPVDVHVKRPVLRRWKRWQTERQSLTELDRLRTRFPEHGVGIVLGGPELSLLDIETDSEAGEAHLASSGLPVPDTCAFTSPRGRHRLFRGPGRLPRRINALPDVDVLGSGFAIVPPSTGRVWQRELNALVELPQTWVDFLDDRGGQTFTTCLTETFTTCPERALKTSSECDPGGLLAILSTPDALAAIAPLLGLPTTETHRTFRCVLHEETKPSAALLVGANGAIVYRDCHAPRRGAPEILTLPEVYAARVSGEARRLRGSEFVTWAIRLALAAGLVESQAEVPVLHDAPPHVCRVLDGWRDLVAVKRSRLARFTDTDRTTFSVRFAASWSGVLKSHAEEAIYWMRRSGVLVPCGWHRRARLYAMPAPLSGRQT